MSIFSDNEGVRANEGSDANVKTNSTVDTDVSEPPDWFVAAAQVLLAPKPGFILDLETGCGERNGYRYTTGAYPVPGYVLERLLLGPHGWQWLCALMEQGDAAWWAELNQAIRGISKFKR